MWSICMLVLAVSMVNARVPHPTDPLIQWVECKGTFLTVAFWKNSSFAKSTFESGMLKIVDVHKKSDKNSTVHNCGGGISDGSNTATFNYTACDVSITTILLPHDYSIQRVSIDLEASPVNIPNIPPVFVTVDCTYQHSTNSSGNATIHNGGNVNPGNNTGNVNATYAVVPITDTLVNFEKESTWDENETNIPTVNIGTLMGFALRFNDTTPEYRQMNPNYCFFSGSSNMSVDTAIFPFVQYNCPADSINHLPGGQTLVEGWEVNDDNTRYLVKFTAFQYSTKPQLYIHCVVNLCIDDACNVTNLNCDGTNWNVSGQYAPTFATPSNDYEHPPLDHSQMLARHRAILSYAAAHSNTHVFKSGAVHLKINEGSSSIWGIVVGVIGGLFVVSLIVLGVLMARRRKAVYVEKQVAGDTRYIVPFQIPRAQLDPASLPTSSRGSEATMSEHGSSNSRSTQPLTTF